MLVRSFDQIVSRICVTSGESIDGFVQRRTQPRDPLAAAVVAFADQEPVALGRKVGRHAGGDDFVGGKHHAADNPSCFRDGGAQATAGIEEGQIRHRRMFWREPDIVPPGNAVLRETPRRYPRRAAAAATFTRGWRGQLPSACR